jgi:hypothetical protein
MNELDSIVTDGVRRMGKKTICCFAWFLVLSGQLRFKPGASQLGQSIAARVTVFNAQALAL